MSALTTDLINLAPGVSEGSSCGSGDVTGNSFQMDGVELVDSWLGSDIYTTPIDYSVIEESPVIALGAAGMGKLFKDPTNQINVQGRSVISPRHALKIQLTYLFPWDISLSAAYSNISGRTWTRNVYVTAVKQSKPYMLTEPAGSRRLPATNNLDLRLEKAFAYRNSRLALMLDMFNAFNEGTETRVFDVAGPSFGLETRVCAPRTFRAGLRFNF